MIEEVAIPARPAACPQCKLPTDGGAPFCVRCGFDLSYGRVARTKKGICAFCAQRGRLTVEHIFPKWLSRRYPLRFTQVSHTLLRPQQLRFFEPQVRHLGRGPGEGKGDPYQRTTSDNVCEPCNNGWMAALQAEAQPLVIELAEGKARPLSGHENRVLARWCMMTSINLGYRGGIVDVPHWQRAMVMDGAAPPGWRIAFGKMANTGQAGSSFYGNRAMPIAVGADDDPLTFQLSYFCIERALFVIQSTLGDKIGQIIQFSGFDFGRIVHDFRLWELWPELTDPPAKLVPLSGASLDAVIRRSHGQQY